MKQVLFIALAFALVPLSSWAQKAEIVSTPGNVSGIAMGLPIANSGEQESGAVLLAQGTTAVCSVAGSSGTKRKCPTKGRTLTFPVTIGVYR